MIRAYQNSDFPERELYEDAIKRHVCSHCIDFGMDGKCHSIDPQGCAIFRFLPDVVTITKFVASGLKMEPYIEALRTNVCMKCKNQSSGGECKLRDGFDCGLDRYLPLVIDAMEEVQERIV